MAAQAGYQAFDLDPMTRGRPGMRAESQLEQQNAQPTRGFFFAFTPESFKRGGGEGGNPEVQMEDALEQRLESWHSQMIALGSAIGTGLFVGVGTGLAASGPLPLLAAFAFVGFTLSFTIFALGEMATLMPLPGAFVVHAKRFIGEAWAATMGWK